MKKQILMEQNLWLVMQYYFSQER